MADSPVDPPAAGLKNVEDAALQPLHVELTCVADVCQDLAELPPGRGGCGGAVELAKDPPSGLPGPPQADPRITDPGQEGAPRLAEWHPLITPVHPDPDRDPGQAADAVPRPFGQQGQQEHALIRRVERLARALP